jgi:hypothetical protein
MVGRTLLWYRLLSHEYFSTLLLLMILESIKVYEWIVVDMIRIRNRIISTTEWKVYKFTPVYFSTLLVENLCFPISSSNWRRPLHLLKCLGRFRSSLRLEKSFLSGKELLGGIERIVKSANQIVIMNNLLTFLLIIWYSGSRLMWSLVMSI